uniref:RNA-directed DNA polymerase, eukaryota, reverse transcriptase zinc-binding domain protein n=1 Tax=Tanacetum cinerariifolium TaxID=118510 RepID=A0A6L2KKJ3_TANCI|nr:hypothetical protein [Tanacetum cinerariifolium]
MVKWVMDCVTSASCSIGINGDLHGFFNGKRGLGQGDLMSPYKFTLVMKVLTIEACYVGSLLHALILGFDFFLSRIVHDIGQLMRGFFWHLGEMNKGKAKVSWDFICMPEFKGGPGVRRLADVNVALTTTYIWSILMHKEPLWVKWVHTYKLIGRRFWDVVPHVDMS